MKIEYLPINQVKLNPDNPRQITKAKMALLVKSLQDCPSLFDARPLLISTRTGENIIIGGNMRYRAAKQLKYEKAPCIILQELTEAQEKEIAIKDNGSWGEWDYDILANEWSDLPLNDWGIDLPKDFITEPESEADAEPQIDRAAELQQKWNVQIGQLWRLGKHRLVCGDSTEKTAVDKLFNGQVPFIMVTDPPYGVQYDPEWRKKLDHFHKHSLGKVLNDDRFDWSAAWKLFEGDVLYVWHAGKYVSKVAESIELCDYEIRSQIIWKKQHFVFSRGDYHWHHEPCWYAVRKGKKSKWNGDRTQSTIWEIANSNPFGNGRQPEEKTSHSTEKPVECMARPIRNHGNENDIVYDPFLGSGTTVIACEQLGRTCYAVEISPEYVAVSIQRWVDITGKEPKLL
jgi:DNA modification methylase